MFRLINQWNLPTYININLFEFDFVKFEVLDWFTTLKNFFCFCISASKAVEILEAYEGTLEDDYPPDNERCEHGEMLLYKVSSLKTYTCSSHLFSDSVSCLML